MTALALQSVDLFAGAGGWSHGWRMATGAEPMLAVNHCAHAVRLHELNHPSTQHFLEDVRAVDPRAAVDGRRVDWLHLSPDCFPAGTPVLTDRGSMPIEAVKVGDRVLTHRGRWRAVTNTMRTTKRTLKLRGQGHPGLEVSAEHPFLADNGESWVAAGDLVGHRWATPARVNPVGFFLDGEPDPEIPNEMWVAGRYVADGWIRLSVRGSGRHDASVTLTIGSAKADEARVELAKTGLSWRERVMPTSTVQFTVTNRRLAIWLTENFGHLASGKRVAGWLLGQDEFERREFLRGYLSGDGYSDGVTVEACTVSRCLAADLRVLAATLGYSPCMYEANEPGEAVIEGRTVTVRQSWSVRWKLASQRTQTKRTADHLWARVKESMPGSDAVDVFNLSVAEDESYVADGIVVHNCTHFSRAKGGKPREQGIRGLAWVGVDWAREARPRILSLENVAEFLTWGPLDAAGQPIKAQAGETFAEFVAALRSLGYAVEWRVLCAADFGAPTIRKRLFLLARRDGLPIRWPAPTHADPSKRNLFDAGLQPWRTAASCIDWSVPCPSIFARKKPLAPATCRRIAAGIVRFVLQGKPFLVNLTHGGRLESLNEPVRTITAAHRGEKALVAAFLQQNFTGMVGKPLTVPVPTITARDHHSLVAAHLTQFREGDNRNRSLDDPMPTITSGSGSKRPAGAAHATGLVAAFLTTYYQQGGTANRLDAPAPAVVTKARHGLVTVSIDGADYVLADIGLRMLTPRELARAQGFPDSYQLEGSKADQIARIGNSVVPQVAAALVRANTGGA